jgi:hypothetical protein
VVKHGIQASIRTLRRGGRAGFGGVVHVLIRCFHKGAERHFLVPALGAGPVLAWLRDRSKSVRLRFIGNIGFKE